MGQYGSACSCMSRPKPQPVKDWDSVAPTLRRGDIVLLSGTAPISNLVKRLTMFVVGCNAKAKDYSHIGVVVEPPFTNDAVEASFEEGPYMIEAIDNMDINVPDVSGESKIKQVHIVPAAKRIFGVHEGRHLYNKVAVRRLTNFEWTEERIAKFTAAMNATKGRPLNQTPRVATNYIVDVGTGEKHDITCSELVVELYKSVGLMDSSANPRKYTPFHFSENTSEVRLLLGASLAAEEVVLHRNDEEEETKGITSGEGNAASSTAK